LKSADIWQNSVIIKENIAEKVREIKSLRGKNIYLDGSSVLAHFLLEHDLVDQINLLLYPVVLGSGKKLFPNGLRADFRLIDTRHFPSGVVLLQYAHA